MSNQNGCCEKNTRENKTINGGNKCYDNKNIRYSLTTLDLPKIRESKVFVIYTGGTIGMVKNECGVLVPQRGVFENLIRGFPQLHDSAYWRQKLMTSSGFDASFLVLPEVQNLRVFYKIYEYEDLLDSSNMKVEDWIRISKDIMKEYDKFDGFVVLHGTDTLAYTASALSFMFENIGKSIILTGSQIPIFEPRSDGPDNFVSSLLIAGTLSIPEVTIFFANKLFRGNRTKKISSQQFYAFDSPNCAPLVEFGIDMEVNTQAIFRPTVIQKCQLHDTMCKEVGILRIFPSINAAVVKAFCQPPVKGVVIETYGAGNIPSNRLDIIDEINTAVKRGVIVVNITQCNSGSVIAPIYETGRLIAECGVVSGYDLTPEAALAKLAYVLSKNELSYKEKVEMMMTNIRGELTNTSSITVEDSSLTDALAQCLNIQSPKKLHNIMEKVFQALLIHAIEEGDVRAIQKILDMGANINAQNTEGRIALHEAIMFGNVEIVEFLLKNGANVHFKSSCGESPLITAIHMENIPIIEVLMKCGAHLSGKHSKTVVELNSLAARSGSLKKMKALQAAGADFDIADDVMQTPLHKAVMWQRCDIVEYLLDQNVNINVADAFGLTPLAYAQRLKNTQLIKLLECPCPTTTLPK